MPNLQKIPDKAPDDPLLVPVEAGKYIGGISIGTLAKWRCYGEGPAFLSIGGKIRYRRSDLEAFLSNCRHHQTSDYSAGGHRG